jgi:hypothetical protein
MLTWGALGNNGSTHALMALAITLAVLGVVVYFLTVHLTIRTPQLSSPVLLLLCFLIYTSSISCGLTSAAVFITVLLSPVNAAAGTALVKPEQFVVTLKVSGTTAVTENKDTPFSISSGQANFGCEEVRTYSVSLPLPPGATFVGRPNASFLNLANASIVAAPVVAADGLSATGALRGLDYQNFALGIRNCPGGGHGELVLAGTYRTAESHEQDATKVISNDLSTVASTPVQVTLPDLNITTIEATCKSKTHPDREWKVTVSPQNTSATAGPLKIVYIPQQKQVSLSVTG